MIEPGAARDCLLVFRRQRPGPRVSEVGVTFLFARKRRRSSTRPDTLLGVALRARKRSAPLPPGIEHKRFRTTSTVAGTLEHRTAWWTVDAATPPYAWRPIHKIASYSGRDRCAEANKSDHGLRQARPSQAFSGCRGPESLQKPGLLGGVPLLSITQANVEAWVLRTASGCIGYRFPLAVGGGDVAWAQDNWFYAPDLRGFSSLKVKRYI